MTLAVELESTNGGVAVRLMERSRSLLRSRTDTVPYAEWAERSFPGSAIGQAALNRLLQEEETTPQADGTLHLSHAGLASLDALEAAALLLPTSVPLTLEVQTHDQLASDGFRIWTRFVDGRGHRVDTHRDGAIVRVGDDTHRLPGPIFTVVEAVERVAETLSRDERLAAVARLRSLFPEDGPDGVESEEVRLDRFLNGITVRHAHTFTLDVHHDAGEVELDPVPLASWQDNEGEEGPEPVLTPSELTKFQSDFRRGGAAPVHVLAPGHYLFVDPVLRPALEIVERKQRAPVAERLAFAQHPERELEREIGAAAFVADEEGEPRSIFGVGEIYSERVSEIGEWVPPDLPFIKDAPSTWLPERFCVILGRKVVTLGPEDVASAIETIQAARTAGQDVATLAGIEVPTSDATLATLQKLPRIETPPAAETPELEKEESPEEILARPLMVGTKTNHHVLDYERTFAPRETPSATPAMASMLREHQDVALAWMQACWQRGRPGVLLADDMGLGKTIEVLSFLSWLREAEERRPFLIVAPTSLLDNWTREHDTHLARELGLRVTAYGAGLRSLRGEKGREWELGRALLDRGRMGLDVGEEPVFVLTTYETLRDYQFSFATIPFAVAVYDETQKVKNPKSRMTAAAKSVNADFSIAMTGTPVENAMSDLWSIADLVSPGMLPALREFHRENTIDKPENLEALRDLLLEARPDGTPPFALRRMKDEVVSLPKMREDHHRETMVGAQAEAYGEAVNRAIVAGGRERLRVLHDMRSISLHPIDPRGPDVPDDAEYIAASARMRRAFEVLDKVHAEGSKAIVFLQSRKVQDHLGALIQRRYHQTQAPHLVRGDTRPSDRQARVDAFSAAPGFGVIILSPRAAGVGLNVQAATHVIHLDRWWNPAVEDQCTARAYRIGQEQEVTVHYPLALHPAHDEGSYDIVLDGILERKRQLSRSLFVPTELSASDFAQLIGGTTGGSATSNEVELTAIDARGPGSFEDWVTQQLRQAGLTVSDTPGSGDGGADAIVRGKDGEITHIVQCKHTSHPGRPKEGGIVQDMERVGARWKTATARFVAITNAEAFAPGPRRRLEDGDAIIIERAELTRLGAIVAAEHV